MNKHSRLECFTAIASHNREQDLNIADDQEKDTILLYCQKTLNKLIEKYGIRLNGSSSASFVACFAILSALHRLDPDRRSFLIHLLYEARLITHPTVISLQSANLTDINLNTVSHSKTLHYVSFQDALMTRAIFHSMNIHGVTFNRAILDNANFSLTNFGRSKIGPNVNFDNADIRRINAEYINLKNCQFGNTNLSESIFDHAIITNSSFKQSQMIKISMKFSEINNTEFSMANLFAANWEYVRCNRCVFNEVNFTNVNLCNAVFVESYFHNCYLSEKQLKQATFLNNKINT